MLYIYRMGKRFTQEELVDFGNYLLSPERIENLLSVAETEDLDKDELFERSLNYVTDMDLEHWRMIRRQSI